MRAVFAITLFGLAACLPGCTQFPDLQSVEGPGVADAPYPRILPLETLLAAPPVTASDGVSAGVAARAAALRARADRLARRPVIDRATRARMARGVPAAP